MGNLPLTADSDCFILRHLLTSDRRIMASFHCITYNFTLPSKKLNLVYWSVVQSCVTCQAPVGLNKETEKEEKKKNRNKNKKKIRKAKRGHYISSIHLGLMQQGPRGCAPLHGYSGVICKVAGKTFPRLSALACRSTPSWKFLDGLSCAPAAMPRLVPCCGLLSHHSSHA